MSYFLIVEENEMDGTGETLLYADYRRAREAFLGKIGDYFLTFILDGRPSNEGSTDLAAYLTEIKSQKFRMTNSDLKNLIALPETEKEFFDVGGEVIFCHSMGNFLLRAIDMQR